MPLLMVVGVVAARAYLAYQPTIYQARVLIATALERSGQLHADDNPDTLADRDGRLASLAEMAISSTIAEDVLAMVGDQLPEPLRQPQAASRSVAGFLIEDSDAIAIYAEHADPRVAVLLADAWARAFIRHVEASYNTSDQEALALAQTQAQTAQERWGQERAAFQAYLQQDRTAEIQQRLDGCEALLASLSAAPADRARRLLADLDATDRLIEATADLRQQVKEGGAAGAASNASAYATLKVRILAGDVATDVPQSQPSGPEARDVVMLRDLDSFTALLEARRATQVDSLSALVRTMAAGQGWAAGDPAAAQAMAADVARLEELARSLRAELAEAHSARQEAEARVNLARDTYDGLTRQIAALQLASEQPDVALWVASPAALVDSSAESRTKPVVLAALAGLILGAILALVWDLRRARTA
jgi:hypothetical protein